MVAARNRAGDEPPQVWEAEILVFEAEERRQAPAPGATLFTGSSSIRMWTTLPGDMAPLPVINRGFGGAQMDAVLHYAPRIVLTPRPRAVVLCAGENDLEAHRGKTPQDVLEDLRRFDELLVSALPGVRLYVLTIKPSPARRATWAAAQCFNELLADYCRDAPHRRCVDVATASFDGRGCVREELFLDDGLHLSAHGYALWTSLLRPMLLADAEAARELEPAEGSTQTARDSEQPPRGSEHAARRPEAPARDSEQPE
ncbi:MAG: GDSL-type esterase/lipase family protein [Candidatus Binatia bacterium]